MYELLYTSTLSDGTDITEIAGILRQARSRNPQRSVSGMLVFDGGRFCQYLEGPQDAVLKLVATIERDRRHAEVVVHHAGPLSALAPRFPERALSFGLASDETEVDAIIAAGGVAAVHMLMTTLPRLDLDP